MKETKATETLSDWQRPYYGMPGGKPFLFYVVFGTFENLPSLSATKYRSLGLPSGFDLMHYDSVQHPKVLADFREGYLWDEFRTRDAELSDCVAHARECLVLRGEIEDTETLNYLRDCIGLLTFLLDHGGIAVYDPQMFYWWAPALWRSRLFEPGSAVPAGHVVVFTSEEPEPDLIWFHTRGMRKFGRPDLSVHNARPENREGVIDLCQRFIEFQAYGGIIEEGKEIRMAKFPDGLACYHCGELDDPDFNNVHVEIR